MSLYSHEWMRKKENKWTNKNFIVSKNYGGAPSYLVYLSI